ncbi:hypothetical protein BJX70DRAFT_397406 [Aspergillus crustosus]
MPFLWILAASVRWARLKIYQYEVTFAIYMLTPTEKFIFSTFFLTPLSKVYPLIVLTLDSLLLTVLSLIVTAIYVYLPDHLRLIYSHLYYYWVGERPFVTSGMAAIGTAFRDSGSQTLRGMYETA